MSKTYLGLQDNAKVKSLNYPSQPLLHLGEGSFFVESDIVKVDYNDDFNPDPNDNLWTENIPNPNNIATQYNNGFQVDWDGEVDDNDSIYNIETDWSFSSENYFICDVDYKVDIDEGQDLEGLNQVFNFKLEDGQSYFRLLHIIDTVNDITELRMNYKDQTHGSEQNDVYQYPSRDITLRFIFCSNGQTYIYNRISKTNFEFLKKVDFDIDEIKDTDSSNISMGVDIKDSGSLSAENIGSTVFHSFDMYPFLNSIPNSNHDYPYPMPTSIKDGEVRYLCKPSYPGNFSSPELYGIGSSIGGYVFTEDVEIFHDVDVEGETRFMDSSVEKFYSDAAALEACRDEAVKTEVNGDGSIGIDCFDDGSALDTDGAEVIFKKGGRIDINVEEMDTKPEFIVKDKSSGNKYGYDFEFKRKFNGFGPNLDDDTVFCRMLELENESKYDRLYYGVQQQYVDEQEVHVKVDTNGYDNKHNSSESSEVDVTFDRVDQDGHTQVLSTQAVLEDESKIFSFDGTSNPKLDRGKYNISIIDPLAGNINFGCEVTIYYGSVSPDNIVHQVDTTNYFDNNYEDDDVFSDANTGREVIPNLDIIFHVREKHGKCFAFLHDVDSGDFVEKKDLGDIEPYISSRSLSMVENDDGDIVKIAKKYDNTISYKENRESGKLHCEVFDPSDLSKKYSFNFNMSRTDLLSGEYIHAFDVEKTNDSYKVAICPGGRTSHYVGNSLNYYDNDTNEEKYGYNQYLPNIKQEVKIYEKQSNEWLLSNNIEQKNLLPNDLEKKYRPDSVRQYKRHNRLYERTSCIHRYFNIGIGYIRLNYDKAQNVTLMSMISAYRGIPLIAVGAYGSWKDFYMPFHFNRLLEYKRDSSTSSYISSLTNFYTGITSLDAAFGNDGFVYSVATNPHRDFGSLEIGIMDQSFYYDGGSNFVDANISIGRQLNNQIAVGGKKSSFYKPIHKFKSFPIIDYYGSSYPKTHNSEIVRDFHYLNITQGRKNTDTLSIYSNGDYDQFPVITTNEEKMDPKLGTSTPYSIGPDDTVQNQYVSVPDTQDGYVIRNLNQDSPSYSSYSSNKKGGYGDYGYKFHWRIRELPDSQSFNDSFQLYASPRNNNDNDQGAGSFNMNTGVRFKLNGNGEAKCQYYNYQDSSWVTGKTINYSQDGEIIDFYIFSKLYDFDKNNQEATYEHLFLIKRSNSVDDTRNGVFNYDRKNDVIGVYYTNNDLSSFQIVSNSNLDTYQTLFSCEFLDGSGEHPNDKVHVYSMGWNLLKNISNDLDSIDNHDDNDFPYGADVARYMSDMKIFNQYHSFNLSDEQPRNYFPTFRYVFPNSYHWYNGFLYSPSTYLEYYSGDTFTLDRKDHSRLDNLLSNSIYGKWRNDTDTKQIEIWADANDSDLDRLQANTFIVEGVNVPMVEVGERGGEKIGTIDNRIHKINKENILSIDDLGNGRHVIKVEGMNFGPKSFSDFDYYYYQEGEVITKLLKAQGNEIYVEHNTSLSENFDYDKQTDHHIFCSRGSLVTDYINSFQLLGFVFEQVDVSATNYTSTYHGYFTIGTLDFGVGKNIPLKYNHSSGEISLSSESNLEFVYNQQAFNSFTRKRKKSFSYEYDLLDAANYVKMKSEIDNLKYNQKPIWIINNYKAYPTDVYLSLMSSDPSFDIVYDEKGKRTYRASFEFNQLR